MNSVFVSAEKIPQPRTKSSLPPPENKAFYPALDGLRALAVISVFLYHYGNNTFFWWGWMGVDLFFVLSGFLITGILYDTLRKPHFFRTFYTRRALRIFPLYYALWLLALVLTPVFHIVWDKALIVWPFYLGNLVRPWSILHHFSTFYLYVRSSSGVVHPAVVVGHFWSLCVEEQFYFMWPLVVFWIRDRRRLMQICGVYIVAALLVRCLVWSQLPAPFREGGVLYTFPLTRSDTLLCGAFIALWLRSPGASIALVRSRFRYAGRAAIALLALTCALIFVHSGTGPDFSNNQIQTFGYTLISFAGLWVLLAALDARSLLYRLLLWRPLIRIGRVSYGIYILHLLPFLLFERFTGPGTSPLLRHLSLPLFFAATWLLAELSFRFFETPFLRLKDRLAPA